MRESHFTVGEPEADGVCDPPGVTRSVGGGSGSESVCVTAVGHRLSPFSISKLPWGKRDPPGPLAWVLLGSLAQALLHEAICTTARGSIPRLRDTVVTLHLYGAGRAACVHMATAAVSRS